MLPLPPEQWAELTFGCADLGDKRRTKRLIHTAADLSAHTGSSLAESCEGNLASVEGGYRLIENEAVDPEAIAEAGFQATVHASEDSELILALEDSTTLSYKHSARSELGDLGGPEDAKTKGFWAHSVMLLDAEIRWRIEEFHKAWKTGAGVERQRMQSADNLERMAVILMFVAVRLIQIREALMLPYVRKQTGDEVWHEKTSADQVVSDDEWQVLWLKMESKKLPDKPPPLIWLFQTIAKLGGWCDSKHTGRPGWLAVWKGWAKLQLSVEGWRIARQFWGVEM